MAKKLAVTTAIFLFFFNGVTGKTDAQLLENLVIDLAQHYRTMYLTTIELW